MDADAVDLGLITKFAAAVGSMSDTELRFFLQSLARELLPTERIRVCYRCKIPTVEAIEVKLAPERRRARYAGLMKCRSVWVCPVCAAYITEQRRQDLTDALNNHRDRYLPIMVTLTVRHNKADSLTFLLANMLEAYRSMLKNRFWGVLMEEYGIDGSVRGLECTYGDHGWHPHQHVLMLVDMNIVDPKRIPPQELADSLSVQISREWLEALKRKGLNATWAHGVKVTCDHGEIAEYVTKYGKLPRIKESQWTVVHEVTKAPSKRGKAEGKTAFQLLLEYGQGDQEAGRLFVEYAAAFKGRSQLQWSRGLRAKLGLDEDTSEENDPENEIEWLTMAWLDADQWRVILRNDLRAQVLDLALKGDPVALAEWLAKVPGMHEATPRGFDDIKNDPRRTWTPPPGGGWSKT